MAPGIEERRVPAFETISPQQMAALLERARMLQAQAGEGKSKRLLHGANVAFLCECGGDDDAALFRFAVRDLGAQIANLRPSVTVPAKTSELPRTAHVLQGLYDAVDCRGVDHELVRRLAFHTDVPVYEDLSSLHHPAARLMDQLDSSLSLRERRRIAIQAVLLNTIK